MARKKKVETVKNDFNSIFYDLNVEDKFITFNGVEICIKQYLPIEQKINFINQVVQACFFVENDMFNFNMLFKDVMEVYCFAKYYTDLKVPEDDFVGVYDKLVSSGLITEIKNNIPECELKYYKDRICNCIWAVREQTQYELEKKNSVGYVINNIIEYFKSVDINELSEQMKNLKNADVLKAIYESEK